MRNGLHLAALLRRFEPVPGQGFEGDFARGLLNVGTRVGRSEWVCGLGGDMRAKPSTDALIAFVGARLSETASQAELFHELACTAVASGVSGARTAVLEGCACPVPRQILDRALALRSVLDDCEQRIRCQDPHDPKGPLDAVFAEQTLRALALPFELHPQWQDAWLPG